MGIFGWSYPPGCSGPPDEPEGPCLICGAPIEDCLCMECDVAVRVNGAGDTVPCGTIGCVEHMNDGRLADLINELKYRVFELMKEATKREKKTSPCPKCGTVHTLTIFQCDSPAFCCGMEYWRGAWEDVPL